jgi:cellulose biosynthesis protein BcsQ
VPSGDAFDLIIKILAALAAPSAGLAIWALTRHIRLAHLQAEHETLRREHESLQGKLEETRRLGEEVRQASIARHDKLRDSYLDARDKFYRIKALVHRQRDELDSLRRTVAPQPADPSESQKLTAQIDDLECQLAGAQRELQEEQERIAEIARSDGRLWLRPPPDNSPAFRPPSERNNIIISVLNFKGGVGKTTVTANLAATLARLGKPALLLDLDYQRSLSMLLVDNPERKLLHRAGVSVQHFLSGQNHSAPELVKRLKDLSPALPACALLPNSDSRSGSHGADGLEETETRLMLEWLVDRSKPDPRFFLRRALHERSLGEAYPFVLLDCPPRLTTACVNALAASDYVLIPVVPDPISTRAVENLLTTLRSFRDQLCPKLRVLAVVPNMVRIIRNEPMRAHADALVDLKAALLERWDEPIRITEACIKHDSAFGSAAAELDAGKKLRLAISDAAVAQCFSDLAQELLEEIREHESSRTPAVPAKPGPRARSSR